MKTFFRMSVVLSIAAMVLYACNTPVPPVPSDPTDEELGLIQVDGNPASVGLSVVAVNASAGFSTVGQVITYNYTVTNTGTTPLAGPVTIADDKTSVPTCPAVNTVGNNNDNLDTGESVLCTSAYTIQQKDIATTQLVTNSIARVGNVDSNRVTTILSMAFTQGLAVSCTTNPTSYSAAGQSIIYSYTIKNVGATAIGPTQFTVKDSLFSAAISCDIPNRTLGPNESISCSGTYTTSQNDANATQIANSVTASGGTSTSPAASCAVAKSTVPPVSGNFTPGSTIQHSVRPGEWLYQIARCYGADIKETLAANRTIPDPNFILPAMTVTVPNIGKDGKRIFGPPCVGYHVVASGENLNTIAQKYNADPTVLQFVNKNSAFGVGTCVKVPLNSAGTANLAQTALTACPGGSPNPIPNPDSIRINIPASGGSVSVSGTVNSGSKVRYLLSTTSGQTLNVKVTGPGNEVSLAVIASNGAVLKSQDTTLTFTGTIPSTGDAVIEVAGISGSNSKSFLLDVALTAVPTNLFERVVDINPGINSSDPAYLTVFNGQLFFRATGNDNTGPELWKLDTPTKTPVRVLDTAVGSVGADPSFLTVFNNLLYFRANAADGTGSELWRFNGSDDGMMPEINPGAADSSPSYLALFNNALYFSARGNDGLGNELWRTDGTSSVRVADINAGAGDSNPAYLTVFNNALYFSAVSTDGMGVELWRFDGTNAPTRVTDINPGIGNSNPSHLAVFNGALYFSANANDGAGVELWKFDGTTATRAADINPGAGDSAPAFLTVFGNALYFSANGDSAGIELWKFDGTTAKRVGDLNNVGNSSPSYLFVFNNELYFQANGNDNAGTELWKFKGP